MAINKVVYGDQTLIDLSVDTVSDTADIVEGKYAHLKNGTRIQGTRPSFYLRNTNTITSRIEPLQIPEDEGRVEVGTLFGKIKVRPNQDYSYNIYLRQNGTSVQLVSYKDDNETESVVTLKTISNATLRNTFYIDRIYFLDATHMIVQYRYQAATSGYLSPVYVRCIIMKADGSLLMGTEISISDTPTATLECNAWITKGFYGDFMYVWKDRNTSTNAITGGAKRMYLNHITGAFTKDSQNSIISLTSGTNVKFNDFNDSVPFLNGGFFCRNKDGVDYVVWFGNYDSGNYKSWKLSDAGQDLAEKGSNNHWILGMDSFGHTVTVKIDETNDRYTIYLWMVDPTSATDSWRFVSGGFFPLSSFQASAWKFIYFKNGIFTIRNNITGEIRAYQINVYTTSGANRHKAFRLSLMYGTVLSYAKDTCGGNPFYDAGPESDIFNGIFID